MDLAEYSPTTLLPSIVRCPFSPCNARIISSENLPQVSVQNSPQLVNIQKDQQHDTFYMIDDVWQFDNIGVLRPAEDLSQPTIEGSTDIKIERLLICSECDKGPLGFAGFQGNETDIKKLKYYLSCRSVLYQLQ